MAMIRRDVFDNPGEAQERAKELGLDGIHSHEEDGKTVFMPGKTHEEYMKKTGGKDVEQKVESYHKKKEDEYMSVTIDLEVDEMEAVVEAATGKSIIELRGVAFHEGFNKNGWSLTREAAEKVIPQMIGADVTLNHPKTKEQGAGFTRNMDGGVDEAVVGVVRYASIHDLPEGKWEVRYVAHVVRTELFNALESGLWNRDNYGVSIGGTGIPVFLCRVKPMKNT